MLTILIRPRLPRPGFRVVILIVILLATSRFAPDMTAPLGLGTCLGWLAAQPACETETAAASGRAG